MIDEFIEELKELQSYKKRYEYAVKDKQVMSDMLFKYMLKEYDNTSYEQRCKLHEEDICKNCVRNDCCEHDLPQDILKLIPSDKAWIPAKKICIKRG